MLADKNLRHGLRRGTNIFSEKLGEWGEHPILQGDDPDRHSLVGEGYGQSLKRRVPSCNLQHESWQHWKESSGREDFVFHVLRQTKDRRARRFVTARAKGLCNERAEKTVRWKERPRLISQLRKGKLAPSCQRIFGRRHHHKRIITKDFGGKLVWHLTDHSTNSKLDVSFDQIFVEGRGVARDNMNGYLGMLAGETVNDGRHKRRCDRLGCPDANVAFGRIGEELDILEALTQIVEDCETAFCQRDPIGGRYDAAPPAINELCADGILQLQNRLGN